MKFVKHLLFLAVLFSSTQVQAQYEHIFTNYFMSPMTLNPAMTGAYEGTYRVGGLRRQQWNAGPSSSLFGTTSVFVDMPVIMIQKRHWIGAGLSFYNDVARGFTNEERKNVATTLTQTSPALSVAFHYALDKKYRNVLSFAVKGGRCAYKLALADIPLATSELSKAIPIVDKSWRPAETTRPFLDLSLGLMLKSKIDKKSDLTVGVALGHINTPKFGFYTKGTAATLPTAFTGHVEYNRMINKKLTFSPNFLFRTIAGSRDISLQGVFGYQLDQKRKDLILKGGLGFRGFNNHAVNILLGADYQNFKFMLGYDIPTGVIALAENNTIELALHYTGKVYKNPVVKGIHFCPKY